MKPYNEDIFFDRFLIIRNYYNEHGVLPSYSYMTTLFNVKSKTTVLKFINELKNREIISIAPDKGLKPGINFNFFDE